jgi:hypothetical protein
MAMNLRRIRLAIVIFCEIYAHPNEWTRINPQTGHVERWRTKPEEDEVLHPFGPELERLRREMRGERPKGR